MSSCDHDKINEIVKYVGIAGAISMIVVGIASFFTLTLIPYEYILNIYKVILGGVYLATCFKNKTILDYFYFLTTLFGKAVFSLLCGLLCFQADKWFALCVGILWLCLFVLYFVLGIIYAKDDCSGQSSSSDDRANPNDINVEVK